MIFDLFATYVTLPSVTRLRQTRRNDARTSAEPGCRRQERHEMQQPCVVSTWNRFRLRSEVILRQFGDCVLKRPAFGNRCVNVGPGRT
jgi:hypothetical protein